MFISIKKSRLTRIPTLFKVRDKECLGCPCFKPGIAKYKKDKRIFHSSLYHNRKENNPLFFKACLNMISPNGCPIDTGYSEELKTQRIEKLWGITVI